MSTKTTFKRVALVAVAALGLGVLSVAPSSAAVNAASLTLSAATAAQTTAETSTVTSATVTLKFLSAVENDSMSIIASLDSGPGTSTALPYLELVETTSAFVDSDTAGSSAALLTQIAPNTKSNVENVGATGTGTYASAKYKVYLGTSGTAAPTVAGTYVVKLTAATVNSTSGTAPAAALLTITVTADAGLVTTASPSLSTSIISGNFTGNAETTTPAVAGVDDVVSKAKTVDTNAAAMILVTQANAAGKGLASTPASVGESLTVVVTGPGSIASIAAAADMSGIAKTGARALTLKNGHAVGVFADGSSGVSTITFTNAAGTVIATETVTFYSTVTSKLTAKVLKAYVLAGGTASDGSAAAGPTNTNGRVFLVNATDADGRDMASGAGTLTVKPTSATTDALIGAAGVCTYAAKTTTAAAGYYCSTPGVSSAKFGKVNYTITATNADASTVTTTADVTFADQQIASFTITGPASASVGEKVTLTFTAKEKNGYPVADLSYEGVNTNSRDLWETVVSSNSAFAPFANGETITTVSGVATTEIYVPATAGTVSVTWTGVGTAGTASGALAKTLTELDTVYTMSIVNPGVDAATDAANEATDAANAATDAALAAADAADAATAAAEDASEAVAKLAKSVNTQLKALKKQLTSLIALVNKLR
jgi:hypothetical protein